LSPEKSGLCYFPPLPNSESDFEYGIILRMKVSELGEFGLIDLLAKMIAESQDNQPGYPSFTVGIGDDAAAWQTRAPNQLATVDSLIEDVHFSFGNISWQELGWKSLAVNLSDIAAMGGAPEYALISLGLPEKTEVEDITSFYQGMMELAQKFNVSLAGGDTCQSPVVMITVAVLGTGQETLLRRSTASPGDIIAVTGHLGGAAAGLDILTSKLSLAPATTTALREAFNKPFPRVAEGQLLVKQGIRTAIDISDGFLADLRHIGQMSRVSARVDIDLIPIYPPVKEVYGDRALEMALSGGEDYELLFTGADSDIEKFRAEASCPVTVVGEITRDSPGEISLFDKNGQPFRIKQTGWEHFKK
jgi:thiamine-monophosphate kinase